MKWTIEGANVDTGEDQVITVDAKTRADAETEARLRGLLVSAVRPATGLDDAEAADALAAAAQGRSPHRVNYRTPQTSANVPGYGSLRFAVGVVMGIAWLYYIAGALLVLLAILSIVADRSLGLIGGPIFVAWGIAAIAGGGVMHLMSAAGDALRDLVRNSYRR